MEPKNETPRPYTRIQVPPLMHHVEFCWKFVSDATPVSVDVQNSMCGTQSYTNLDHCLADALNCQINPANIGSTKLVIEAEIYGDWTSLTNNDLRQTFNVYAARRLFYPTTLQAR